MTFKEETVELFKKYFGTNNPALSGDMDIIISRNQVSSLMAKFDLEPIDEVVDILWLCANAGYDRSYEKYEQAFEELIDEDEEVWNTMKRDIIELHKLFDGKHNAHITVSIGKKSVEVTNWFQRFFHKYCYSELIDDDEVLEISKNKQGRPAKNRLENDIMYGMSQIAKDYKLVKGKAPKNLCLFIWDYMELMKMVNSDDGDYEWVRTRITKKLEKLFTPECELMTSEELAKYGTARQKIDYLTKLA